MINYIYNAASSSVPDISTAFTINGFEIKWYGILMALGFVAAILLACLKLEKWYKISCNPFYCFVFIGIPVSILGARIWSFAIGDASKLIAEKGNVIEAFFDFRQGGLAIEGGVMLTVVAALIYFPLILKKPKYHVKTKIGDEVFVKQVSMWVYADAIVPCILVGQIIGRWGNFFNHEVYGPATSPESLTWLKILMPGVYEHMLMDDGSYHQPFFLYESFVNFWFFIGIYIGGEFIKQRKAGDLAIAYFICYGLLRACMEPFRYSEYHFPLSVVTSILFVVIGIALLIFNHLYLAKHRDFMFTAFFTYKAKCYYKNTIEFLKKGYSNFVNVNKQRINKIKNKDNQENNKVIKEVNKPKTNLKEKIKEPNFYRKPNEIFYYNGH